MKQKESAPYLYAVSIKKFIQWPGQRDSNPRSPAPKAGAVPSSAIPGWCPRRDLNPHVQRTQDFKSRLSAYSNTRAYLPTEGRVYYKNICLLHDFFHITDHI